MTLLILFAQRTCSYEGQYAPEALEIMTEYANDDNPDYLRDKLEHYRKSNEFTALQIIPVRVSDIEIEANLCPKIKPVMGKIS